MRISRLPIAGRLILGVLLGCGAGMVQAQSENSEAPMLLQGLEVEPVFTFITQDQLLQKIAGSGYAKVDIRQRTNGLRVNGKTLRDADGEIAQSAFDALTGDITYLVKRSSQWWVKYVNPARGISPVWVARITQKEKIYTYEDVLKHRLTAEQIVLSPKGLLLQSGKQLTLSKHANEPQTGDLPEGWQLAPYQRGNSATTRTVLLEQMHAKADTEFALYNLDTDQLLKLHITACVSDERSRCDPLQNYRKIAWFQVPSGPLAVVQQAQRVTLIDLSSGRQVDVMPEQAALELIECEQTAQGGVSLYVKNANQEWHIEDVTQLLALQNRAAQE
jgi:hypothetical protein